LVVVGVNVVTSLELNAEEIKDLFGKDTSDLSMWHLAEPMG
jgi:hypothetical protein